MRHIFLAFCLTILLSSSVFAAPDHSAWGYKGDNKKTWVDDPTLIAKATSKSTAKTGTSWVKMIVILGLVGVGVYFFKARE